MLCKSFEPVVDAGDVGGGLVADGELVVLGGQGPVLLELAEAALHRIAVLVRRRVEGGRPAPGAAASAAVGGLVFLDGDGGLDVVGSQPGPVSTG